MSFDVTADAYGRFMGRFSEPLARRFADLLQLRQGRRALDVGCGSGALTAVLAEHLGAGAVAAVDPSESFVAAVRTRLPGVDVRRAAAERLPFEDAVFDVAAAQLVVHFMADAVAGLTEMARVTRSGGLVAACVWDNGGGRGPLSPFWRVAHDLDPDVVESDRAGTREGRLAELFAAAGLRDVRSGELAVRVTYPTFEDWWEPLTLGVGSTGSYVAGLDDARQAALRAHCAAQLPPPPFEITGVAWSAVGVAG
ncbi:class I SAM-dependent methyltransferase [Pseudonocardia xinjiangensis]|uniref:Class I SAM-dependent methyltransferase n=1 Tax=Pseudonocardia xinjiangensis TaxID=75289 RepID=A0ABX1RDZ4_9PSEU|nr:class I SAM-dependent methyltransferase [Pseudonocardia xinjiangensis]NMH77453.1 class I SAM-dependent methyltransferase [Pseudonocardia xinjiangensis]